MTVGRAVLEQQALAFGGFQMLKGFFGQDHAERVAEFADF
jgi:hypothetical protein